MVQNDQRRVAVFARIPFIGNVKPADGTVTKDAPFTGEFDQPFAKGQFTVTWVPDNDPPQVTIDAKATGIPASNKAEISNLRV